MNTNPLQRTPLADAMIAAGGRMVDFHGWEMPVQFSGILAEHRAVRTACGIFDVSHMGQIFLSGPAAHRVVERLNCNRMTSEPGRGTYSHLLSEGGGILDDAITFCLGPERFMAVVNAATADADYAWMLQQSAGEEVLLENASEHWGMVAIQGPRAPALVGEWFPSAIEIPRFGIQEEVLDGEPVLLMRTGYTGEDGFEVASTPSGILRLWEKACESGKAHGLLPCGLGCRDTLRLEAGYLLYGTDADETRTPYEANCGWVVKLKKGDFVGRDALLRRKEAGFSERLTGVRLLSRGVPRPGCTVWNEDQLRGSLTSASFSPSLQYGIGVGYLDSAAQEPGTRIEVEVHGRRLEAETVRPPFRENAV